MGGISDRSPATGAATQRGLGRPTLDWLRAAMLSAAADVQGAETLAQRRRAIDEFDIASDAFDRLSRLLAARDGDDRATSSVAAGPRRWSRAA